jgi:negative regulator of sigma E activity
MPDSDLDFLRTLDPALHEEPPAPGSARYEAIRAAAIPQPQPRRRPRRWIAWGTAATTVAASALATVLVLNGNTTSASAAVLTAADHTGTVTSLRASTTSVIKFPGGASSTLLEVNGKDLKAVTNYGSSVVTFTVVDGVGYETNTDGTPPHKQKLTADWIPAPFAEATKNVVRAALTDSHVTTTGTDQIRGVKTTHYHAILTDKSRAALAALPVRQTAQLNVEQSKPPLPADQLITLDIWVADNLIRKITTETPERTTTTEYYDFNHQTPIQIPPGF